MPLARFLSLLCALALGAFADGARAGTLSSATWTTELPGYSPEAVVAVPPILASGTSTPASAAVSLTLPAFTTTTFGTGGAFATYRRLTLSGSQMLAITPGAAVATMGVPGLLTVKSAVHAAKGVNASLLTPGVATLVKIPLDVGKTGGVSTGYFYIDFQLHYLTVDFYGWAILPITFTGLTSMSSPLPSVMASGSFGLTALGGGEVLLVSPTRVSIDGPLAQTRRVFLSTLQLQFVPEPGTLLLFVASGLALLAARRTRAPGGG